MTIILSPGRVWSEPGDGGLSRASFPFVVINPHTSGTHNGLATFLYDDARGSAMRFQIVQETNPSATFSRSPTAGIPRCSAACTATRRAT